MIPAWLSTQNFEPWEPCLRVRQGSETSLKHLYYSGIPFSLCLPSPFKFLAEEGTAAGDLHHYPDAMLLAGSISRMRFLASLLSSAPWERQGFWKGFLDPSIWGCLLQAKGFFNGACTCLGKGTLEDVCTGAGRRVLREVA